MASSPKRSASPDPFEDLYEASPEPSRPRASRTVNAAASMSPSPAASTSSDKENRSSRPVDKGKGRAMGPPSVPTSVQGQAKRKRTAERGASPDRNRRRRTVEVDEDQDTPVVDGADMNDYDPDQDVEERRKVRKGLRDLSRKLAENRTEFLAPDSTGITDLLREANHYSNSVKQTSDATIDSRLLVSTADLSYKRTIALISGDTSQGIDMEDFLSKCCQYMRNGDAVDGPQIQASQAASSTQRRRRRGHEEDEENDGDMYNWEYLGRNACLPNISRPAVPGFLLGPLSLEKRVRKAVIRQAKLKVSSLEETRPEVLKEGDIEKAENENLTTLTVQIKARLGRVRQEAAEAANIEQDRLESELDRGLNVTETEKLLDRNRLSDSGGVAFFPFIINPHSFGQTIENMFYVSFLIREGTFGIHFDNQGMPYLEEIKKKKNQKDKERADDAKKCQSIFALDMESWQELIELYEIKEPMIKHREENRSAVGSKGWYA